MKGIKREHSFLMKLGMTAAVLLFTQHALAAGTTAGTDVDNLATVTYEVGTVLQDVVESAPGAGNSTPGAGNGTITTFVVDNRVDFTLTQVGGIHTSVTPGDTNAFVEFTLQNDGNSVQDFRLVATQLDAPDQAFGIADTDANIDNLRVRASTVGVPDPVTDPDFVDELAENAAATIYIYGDADILTGFVNGDVMNIELEAIVAQGGSAGGGAPGADLVDDVGNPDDPATIDIVFGDDAPGLGDGSEIDRHGFTVAAAGLTVSKVATVISDPFNGTTDPKAIPGAVVEYVITVTNAGGALDADNVSITDTVDGDVLFITDFYAGDDLEVVNDGAPISPCNADGGDVDTDGCALDGADLTVGNGNLAITVVAGTSLVVTYRVSIP